MPFVGRLAAGALVASLLGAPMAAHAQANQAKFDPAHPLVGITSPEQWWAKFHTGKPSMVKGDPWGNLTTSGLVDKATGGYWSGQVGKTPAKVAGLPQPDQRGDRATQGMGGIGAEIRSPYPYKTAKEHYEAWLAAANGGTKHTRATLPDWSGDWAGGAQGVLGGDTRISDVMAAISPEYQPRYRQYLHAEWEGHTWWPYAFCMPHGYPQALAGNGATWHFMSDQKMVLINKDRGSNEFFDIYTDGRGFAPPGKLPPQWYGESKGFWDGDELVVYTTNVKRWTMAVGLPETSEKLETIMRIKRFGDKMMLDITIYDPEAFAFPWHDVSILREIKDWLTAPQTYISCIYTSNVYLGEDGTVNSRLPGEQGYRDSADPRPWATAYEAWEKAYPELNAQWEASFKEDEAAAR